DRMFHGAARSVIERLVPRGDGRRKPVALLFHRTEKRGELIEVVLAPPLEGMMVTAGTFHSHTQQRLTEKRGQLGRFAAVPINHRRAVAMIAALNSQQRAGKFIEA